ncbi:MAG TPA: TolC family protein [Polyangiaceae bacterium]|nr:TolC family protein [Polyangiaceae bacterium]
MFRYFRRLACALAAAVAWSNPAAAEPCSAISRANLVECAHRASLDLRAGQAAVRAANGRVQATEPWLPANPVIDVSASRRRAASVSATNWSASLGVQLEVAGQRAARRTAATADRDAQQSAVVATERATAAEAFRLYFQVLSARQSRQVLEQLAAAADRVRLAAKAAAERGAAAGIEADVADATYLAVVRRQLSAARDERSALSSLSSLLGVAPQSSLQVTGALEPLAAAARVQPSFEPRDPPEVVALAAEKRAALARVSAFRRSRVPSPSVSVFVQRDGFDENVVGLGLAFPLPLPEPLGRTFSGEVTENQALAERSAILADQGRRAVRAELARAIAGYAAAAEASRAFDVERVTRAARSSESLATEVQAGRLSIRDAIAFQTPLLELMLGAIEARAELCLTSVEVVHAAGLPLEGSGE